MLNAFPLSSIREQFPGLAGGEEGSPRIFFDNPAGTQVSRQVVDRMSEVLISCNANLGGYFSTSRAVSAVVEEAHEAAADFYNAASAREIVFGQNMTTLTFHLSRCLGRRFSPGDEIILSRMDHDANVAPWLLLAEEKGLNVRWLDFNPETYEFEENAIDGVLGSRTKLVCLCHASNCTGSINDVRAIARKARSAGALTFVDSVQFAPHGRIDVQELAADFVVSSAYKWFGPHQGILWGSEEILNGLFAYKVRPAGDRAPDKFETGTQSHEGMAGCLGAIEYLAGIGEHVATAADRRNATGRSARSKAIHAAFATLSEWEMSLTRRLLAGLAEFKGLTVRGITSANALHRRVPTVSFTLDGHPPDELARNFARANIFVWSGHNYAVEPVARMGLLEKGGVLRVGLAHYNTPDEVDRFLQELGKIARR